MMERHSTACPLFACIVALALVGGTVGASVGQQLEFAQLQAGTNHPGDLTDSYLGGYSVAGAVILTVNSSWFSIRPSLTYSRLPKQGTNEWRRYGDLVIRGGAYSSLTASADLLIGFTRSVTIIPYAVMGTGYTWHTLKRFGYEGGCTATCPVDRYRGSAILSGGVGARWFPSKQIGLTIEGRGLWPIFSSDFEDLDHAIFPISAGIVRRF